MKCPNCGAEARKNETFCGSCGTKIDWSGHVFCPKCGAETVADSVFCEKCGTNIKEAPKQIEENKKKKKKLIFVICIAVLFAVAAIFGGIKYIEHNAEKLYEKGIHHYHAEEYTEAYNCYSKAAARGNAAAMCGLGEMYRSGRGVLKDYSEAIKWYEKAAEKCNIAAMFYLGSMYEQGFGVSQNDEEAKKWYSKALSYALDAPENIDAESMRVLGLGYQFSQWGVPENYLEAVKWYKKAVAKGNARAMANLGIMYGNGQGVSQNYAEEMKWCRKAAENGDTLGMVLLGGMYRAGRGVPQDYAEAMKWYRKAAEKGDIGAMIDLGSMYEEGDGVQQDYTEAVEWYRKAAEKGNTNAQDAIKRIKETIEKQTGAGETAYSDNNNTTVNTTVSQVQINGTRVNMRLNPSMSASVVYQFPGYEYVKVTEKTIAESGKYPWYKVSYNGYVGWVYGQFVK